jgi:hypothetical protein
MPFDEKKPPTDLELYLTDDEATMLKACESEAEWGAACRRIKDARGDKYPADWYARVIQSGLMRDVTAKWGGRPEFTISTGPDDPNPQRFPIGPQKDDDDK